MNTKQKAAFLCGLGLFLLACLFPPWIATTKNSALRTESRTAFHFVFTPPDGGLDGGTDYLSPASVTIVRLDLEILVLRWVLIIVFAGGLLVLFHESTARPRSPLSLDSRDRASSEPSERRYPKVSPEEQDRVLQEVKNLQDEGVTQLPGITSARVTIELREWRNAFVDLWRDERKKHPYLRWVIMLIGFLYVVFETRGCYMHS